MSKRYFAAAAALTLVAIHPASSQGPLNPPGPPAPTMKSLDELDAKLEKRVDVRTLPGDANAMHVISQPGSYYLGGNINSDGRTAIATNSSDVTLDLNGFTLNGQNAQKSGIAATLSFVNLVVRNGIIRGWGQDAIRHENVNSARYERLHLVANTGRGLFTNNRVHVVDCLVANNFGGGVRLNSDASVLDTTVVENGGNGIVANDTVSIERCLVRGNSGNGITVDAGATVTKSVVLANAGDFGIDTGNNAVVTHCSVSFNGSSSTAALSGGIFVGVRSLVAECSSASQMSANGSPTPTTGFGIIAGAGSNVRNCTTSGNKGSGIVATNDCLIIGNIADDNGSQGEGYGIHVTGGDNRIEGNTMSDNDRGIDTTLVNGGNLIIRNSATNNGAQNNANFIISVGNRYGPIVDITAAGAQAPASGNSGASTLNDGAGGSHPWANFAY